MSSTDTGSAYRRGAADSARGYADAARRYARRQPRAADSDLQHVDWLADQLDSRFRIPGLGWRFGWEPVVGLVPGLGDLAGFGISAYIIAQAYRMGARKRTIVRMLGNAGVDALFGSVPLVGTIFDVGFKANRKNVRLLKSELAIQGKRHR